MTVKSVLMRPQGRCLSPLAPLATPLLALSPLLNDNKANIFFAMKYKLAIS